MNNVNKKIMDELLSQPGIKENMAKMTPAELKLCKRLLVSQGSYAQYVRERGE